MPPMPDLVPIQDAAAEFGLDRGTLYRYIKRGKLKKWRREMDVKTYIDREELRKLLEFKPVEDDG